MRSRAADGAAQWTPCWSLESGRRAPAGGVASTTTPPPPARSPERPRVVDVRLKVDRACSPFRYSDLSPLGRRWPTDRSIPTSPPGHQRPSFRSSNADVPEPKSCPERRRSIDFRRSPSPVRRQLRDALERRRHLQVLESNRTLERFMHVLRQEQEAKVTAALFSSNATCRQRPRTISFAAADKPETSSRAGTGNSANKTTWSTTRGRVSNADDDFHLRHRSGKLEASNRRCDIEEDWTSCLDDRPTAARIHR